MTTVDRLTEAAAATFDEVPASHPDAVHTMSRYFAELDTRFDGGQRAGYRAIERYNDNPYARHWFEKAI